MQRIAEIKGSIATAENAEPMDIGLFTSDGQELSNGTFLANAITSLSEPLIYGLWIARNISIRCRTTDNQFLHHEMDDRKHVGSLVRKIAEFLHRPVAEVTLFYHNRRLDEFDPLAFYGITHHSVIQIRCNATVDQVVNTYMGPNVRRLEDLPWLEDVPQLD